MEGAIKSIAQQAEIAASRDPDQQQQQQENKEKKGVVLTLELIDRLRVGQEAGVRVLSGFDLADHERVGDLAEPSLLLTRTVDTACPQQARSVSLCMSMFRQSDGREKGVRQHVHGITILFASLCI